MPASMLVGSATFRAPCYERVYAPIEAALSRLLAQMTQPTAPAQFAFAHEEIHRYAAFFFLVGRQPTYSASVASTPFASTAGTSGCWRT